MREIKFRCFHPDESKMYYFNDFTEIADFTYGDSYRMVNCPDCQVIYMQFTGWFDINGKKIYEGDILKGRMGWIVMWNNDDKKMSLRKITKYMVNGEYADNYYNHLLRDLSEYMRSLVHPEVIGNIYENTDLINPGFIKEKYNEIELG